MTVEEILQEIFRGLKEKYTNADDGHWTKAEILRRVNLGQLKVVRETDCLPTSYTALTSQDGSGNWNQEYTRPNTLMRIDRIWWKQKGRRLFPVNTVDLDIWAEEGRIGKPWTDNTGDLTNYYLRGRFIGLYPKPNAVETWGIEGMRRPDTLLIANISSQIPFQGRMQMYDFHDILVEYVLWKCLLEDQKEIFGEHKNEFWSTIVSIKKRLITNIPDQMETFDLIKTPQRKGRGALPFME